MRGPPRADVTRNAWEYPLAATEDSEYRIFFTTTDYHDIFPQTTAAPIHHAASINHCSAAEKRREAMDGRSVPVALPRLCISAYELFGVVHRRRNRLLAKASFAFGRWNWLNKRRIFNYETSTYIRKLGSSSAFGADPGGFTRLSLV